MPIDDSAVAETGRPVAGPVRTAAQLVPSAVIVELIDAFAYNLDERQYASLAAGLLLAFSWLQNTLEKRRGQVYL